MAAAGRTSSLLNLLLSSEELGLQRGVHQTGEVHARSRMTWRARSPQHTARGSSSVTVAQSTPDSAHTWWLQRQVGTSRTRA